MINLKKGQVWVETVLYTLIVLGLIGLVLAFVSPKITKEKDRISIEQTIESLNILDEKINDVIEAGTDNRRIIEFGLRRGELYFNKNGADKIVIEIDGLKEPYTELDMPVLLGRIEAISSKQGKNSKISLSLPYSHGIADIRFDMKNDEIKFTKSETPYKFFVENKIIDENSVKVEVINFGSL